jgi:hypothetical protein
MRSTARYRTLVAAMQQTLIAMHGASDGRS